jgi:hypothetical protein
MKALALALLVGLLVAASGSIAWAFPQAPPVGASNGNSVLYTVNADLSITGTFDPTTGNPYDGFDDITVGIQNLSGQPVSSITLTGPNIFGFDGDGQAVFPGGMSFGPNTYQGPRNTFSVTNPNLGTVVFSPPLAPFVPSRGPDQTWWSLEATPTTSLPHIAIDEFGVGFNTLNPGPNSGTLRPDPTGGVTGNVLVYDLPFQPVPGDVRILETAGTSVLSDIVRFDQNRHAIFYSDPLEAGELPVPLADTGLPTTLLANLATITEVNPPSNPGEGFATYVPTANQPGFDPSGSTSTYTFTSDVPEPGSITLFLAASLSLAGIALYRWRRDVKG